MKKGSTILLIMLLVSLGILSGIFIGRNTNTNLVSITPEQSISGFKAETESKDTRMDINSATVQQLTVLPGIGETLAERIVDYRQQNGNFSSVDELLYVDGIGKKKLENIEHLIKIGG